MYEGYLALGGGEVLNSARSVGYTTTVDCPVNWLVCPPCDGIPDALGHNPYHYDNISEAPWYDEQDEPTHRFLGAHGISFEGIPDSTREAEVAEGILDGGVVGRVRNGTRRIRVRAMLSALGEDALEVGFSWLNSALTPGRCGLHGDACGAADARFYAACPPARAEITTPLPVWNDPVTNLYTNPSMETAGALTALRTNYIKNPSMEAPGSVVTVELNRAPNPSFEDLAASSPGTGVSTIGQQFSMPTGSAGTMRIVDRGTAVEFWIVCTDPATTHPAFSWNGTVNGAPIGSTLPLPAGFMQRLLFSYAISAADGTPPIAVSWTIMPTNTQGLGGPTTQAVTLTRMTAGTPSTVEVRRNMVSNPSLEVNTTGWAGAGTPNGVLTRTTAQKFVGSASLQVVVDGTAGSQGAYVTTITGAVANATYTGSVFVKGDAGKTMRAELGAKAGGAVIGSRVLGPIVTLTGGWDRLTVTYPATPATTDGMDFVIRNTAAVAHTFFVDAALVEKSVYVGAYFDGSTAPSGDWTFGWTAAANGSPSAQFGALVADTGASGNSYVVSSTQWSGNRDRSLRVISRGTSADSFAEVGGPDGGLRLSMEPGKKYTARATIRMTKAQTGSTIGTRARGISVFFNSTHVESVQPPNEPGVYEVAVTYTVPADSTKAFLRLYNGSGTEGDEVWWDEFMLVEGNYNGPYFDGSTVDERRRNIHRDPRGTSTSSTFYGSTSATFPLTNIIDNPGDIPTAVRATRNATGNARIIDFKPGTFMKASTQYRFLVSVNASGPVNDVLVNARPDVTLSGGSTTWKTVDIPAGQSVIDVTGMTLSSPPTANAGVTLVSAAGAVGVTLDFTGILIAEAPDSGPYFDGDTPVVPYAAAWDGTPDASQSYLYDPDFSYAWTVPTTPDASTSTKTGVQVANRRGGNNQTVVIQSEMRQGGDRAKTARIVSIGDVTDNSAVFYPTSDSEVKDLPNGTYTYSLDVYVPSYSLPVRLQADPPGTGATISMVSTLFDQWERLAVTFVVDAPTGNTVLRLRAETSTPIGAEWWVDREMLVAGGNTEYFDGESGTSGIFTAVWSGTPDNSVSTISAVDVADVAVPNASQAVRWQDSETPTWGTKIARYTLLTAGAAGLPTGAVTPSSGTTYTLTGKVRAKTRATKMIPRIAGAQGAEFTAPVGVWTDFRVTVKAGSGGLAQTGLLLNGTSSGHKAGDVVDIDTALLVVGSYEGAYFDGDYPDSAGSDYDIPGSVLREFDWTGTPGDSTSTFRTGNVTVIEDPELYEEKLFRMVRNLHTVTCVAGPTVIQKYHRGDTWGYQVEFVLVAAVPWMYGDTRPVELAPSIPIVVQDVPFNLVPYPSAELTDGVSVIAATNYVKNPSIEVNTTDWARGSDGTVIPSSAVVLERTTELEAHGSASVRAKFTATTSGANGHFYVQTTVPLPDLNDLTRFSANLWATASIESGTAVLGTLDHTIYWLNSANATLREDDINVGPAAGGAFSLKSMAPPPVGTTQAILRAIIRVTSFSSGAVIRLYADAATVSVP